MTVIQSAGVWFSMFGFFVLFNSPGAKDPIESSIVGGLFAFGGLFTMMIGARRK